MPEILHKRIAHLAHVVSTLRNGLQAAEACIPAINEHLADLATLGIVDFQIEGPTIYCRPAGVSSLHDDEFVIYQAALVMPGGIGAAIWGSTEYHEHTSRPYGEPVDLAPRFAPYEKCPPLVRAMLIGHTGRMLENLMQDVRLLGS
jgi:hypothetical protein